MGEEVPGGQISRPIQLMWLLAMTFLATALFAAVALPFILSGQSSPSGGLEQVIDQPLLPLIVALVILGPLVEEVIFRGWLTGTPQSLLATALFLLLFYGGLGFAAADKNKPGAMVQLAIAGLALGAFICIERWQLRSSPESYATIFPALFWLQGIIFGVLHFGNLKGGSFMLPLLMAAPLVICGWLFGYARIRLGIGSAWLLHALYNLPSAIGIAVMRSQG